MLDRKTIQLLLRHCVYTCTRCLENILGYTYGRISCCVGFVVAYVQRYTDKFPRMLFIHENPIKNYSSHHEDNF